jgi:diguanylate cyclase (GGDEF)-like protein
VLFIDVDDFKVVNDSLGHAAGDSLLVQLADRLRKSTRLGDVVARLGGDEFAIAVSDDESGETARALAERVLASINEPFVISGETITVSVSVGVASWTPEMSSVDELLGQADFAMYTAKSSGKGHYEIYDGRLREVTLQSRAQRHLHSATSVEVPAQRSADDATVSGATVSGATVSGATVSGAEQPPPTPLAARRSGAPGGR